MGSSNKYSPEVRERAVRMVLEHQRDHDSQWAAIESIAEKIGCTSETLRKWVRQAERDQGRRAGLTSAERERRKTRGGSPVIRSWLGAVARCTGASRSALVASLLLLAVAASTADARDYQLPHDPISPKSSEECRALYARYEQIWDQLRLEAKSEGDTAWSIATGGPSLGPGGSIARSRPHYRRASQLHEQASDVLRQGAEARRRCMTQVRNHLRQEERRRQNERTRIRVTTSGDRPSGTHAETARVLDGLPGHAGYQVLRAAGLAGLQGFKGVGRRYTVGGEVYRLPANSYAVSVAESLFRITEIGSAAFGSHSSERSAFLSTGADIGLEAVDRFARWNRLQQVLFRASVGLLLNVQKAASADLDAAFAAFDQALDLQNLERRMSTHSGVEKARFQAALQGVSAAPGDNLADEFGRRIEEAASMRKTRVAAVAPKRSPTVERRKAPPVTRQAAPATRKSRTSGYSAAQCRQLRAQVREYDRAIAQMHANWESFVAGYGDSAREHLDMYQTGRRSNQDLYERHCR